MSPAGRALWLVQLVLEDMLIGCLAFLVQPWSKKVQGVEDKVCYGGEGSTWIDDEDGWKKEKKEQEQASQGPDEVFLVLPQHLLHCGGSMPA